MPRHAAAIVQSSTQFLTAVAAAVITFTDSSLSDPAIISGAVLSASRLPQRRPAHRSIRRHRHGAQPIRDRDSTTYRPE